MGNIDKFLFFGIFFVLFKFSMEQIIFPLNQINNGEPTIVTKETFTVRSNDGTPITVTRINFHRSKNLNGANGEKRTPLELMRLMDERISSIFEEIISQRIGLKLIFNNGNVQHNDKEEENKENKENKEKEESNNNENNKNDEEKNKNEKKENLDEKDFELDENPKEKEDNNKNKATEQEQDKEEKNKTEEKNQNEEDKDKKIETGNNNEEIKDNKKAKRNKIFKRIKEKIDKKVDENKKMIGKLKVNPDVLKHKKRKKTLSKKEIIFSRICKYIFYSIILFTFYILIRKLLEILEIIDPENNTKVKEVKVNNNNPEDKEKEEGDKKEKENIMLNKKRENKLN